MGTTSCCDTFEHAPIGLAHIGLPDGRWLRVNDWLCTMMGYSRDELMALSFRDVTHPDDVARDVDHIGKLIAGESTVCSLQTRCIRKDGGMFWGNLIVSVMRKPSGEPDYGIAVIEDITERKRLDEELRQTNERLSMAQRAGSAGMWDWNMQDGSMPFLSAEYRELYGLTADEPLSYDRWLTLIHEGDRARVEAYGREVFAHGTTYSIEFRIHNPTRGVRWLGSTGLVHRDAEGRPERFSGINVDITALKKAELALRESEERFRKVFEDASTGIALTNWEGRFQQCNAAYSSLLGCSEEELLHMELSALVHPDDREANLAEIRRLQSGERSSLDIENRYVRSDGETIWVQKRLSVLTNETGRPAHVMALVTDITDRRRAEETLKEADRRKDEFLAVLAHELRNPLAPLRTALEVTKESPDTATCDRARAIMERQLMHMVRLVDDLLDVSRINRGKLELTRQRVPLQLVVENAIETSQPLIDAGKHTLALHVPDAPLWVEGDLTRLAQVVSNLLNNSAKYTPDGGHIDVSIFVERDEAVVRVSDDGIGISAEVLPNVFDMFAQATRDPARVKGGLGIGLSLVRRLVEMHGGAVMAESPGLGRGSTFTVRLPRVDAPRTEVERTPAKVSPGPPTRRRVLVVDDNQDAAEMLATVLELRGFETRTASDGPHALAVATEFRPHVAFLDIGLPGMSGHELARQLRAIPLFSELMLVALTGWGGKDDKQRSREAGFDFHLTKPVDLAEVEALMTGPESSHELRTISNDLHR